LILGNGKKPIRQKEPTNRINQTKKLVSQTAQQKTEIMTENNIYAPMVGRAGLG
jgi:sialic acid synthase SpsE